LNHLAVTDVDEVIALAEKAGFRPEDFAGTLLEVTHKAADKSREGGRPERAALRAKLASLDQEARVELLALMFLGRGDGGPMAFRDMLAHARRASDASDVQYLVGKGRALSLYLRNGLREIDAQQSRGSVPPAGPPG
jgi:hypothetical protein